MSQLTNKQDSRQKLVESRIGDLGVMIALLEHDNLRIQQAIDRTGVDDLLRPVLADHCKLIQAIQRVRRDFGEIWKLGQKMRWEEP